MTGHRELSSLPGVELWWMCHAVDGLCGAHLSVPPLATLLRAAAEWFVERMAASAFSCSDLESDSTADRGRGQAQRSRRGLNATTNRLKRFMC